MTQTASIDFAAPRHDVAAPASRKGQGDFMQTMKDVQERETADAPRNERADRPEKIDRPDQAERPDAPAEQQAPEADSPVAEKPAERPDTEAPKQEAPAEKPPASEAEAPTPPQTTEEAQAAIALALATGVQLVQKAQEAQLTAETTVADATAPVTAEVKAMTAQTQAQVPVTDAEAEAQLKLLAEQAKAQALAAGKAEAPVPTQAQAASSDQAEVPALLSQAANGLGKVSMQTSTEAAPTAPQAQNAPESEEGIANLAFQLLAEAADETTPGSTTQATLLDDVTDIETTSQAVNLLDSDGETEAPAGEEKRLDGVNLLNGDRTASSETGKAAGIKAPAPVPAEDVMPQILKHAEQIRAAQSNAVKLQLYPENLGKMEIKVTSHQGVISAQLTAENQQVKAMLETQVAHLQRSFADMGLKVDKVEVTLASANLNFDAQGGAAQGQQQGGFDQQRPNGSPIAFAGNGYEQWLGDEPADERYADLTGATAINYVA